MRRTSVRPFRSRELLGREVRSGLHKSLVIKGNTSIEPARVGVRPGHHEDVADVVRLDVAGSLVAPPDPLEPSVPFQANNLGTGPQHDRWRLFDPANEIAGHGVRQSIFPDQHVDPACPPGTFDSRTSTLSPSDAPYTAAASPAGPAPTTTRSFTRVWSTVSLKPRQSAICAFVGFRNTVSTPQISTGTSAAST